MSEATGEENVYLVFRRQEPGAPLMEAGSVDAKSPELAKLYARENYARRKRTDDLVVVSKAAMESIGEGPYGGSLEKEYRENRGYEEVEGFTA
ncbi:hypothetical protein ACYJ1Y_14810 [Natrialbaceae archaeon A-gly3]